MFLKPVLPKKPIDVVMVKWSRSVVSDSLRPHGLLPTWLLCPWDFPGNSTGVDCHFLLQRIFPTQGSNPGAPRVGRRVTVWATREIWSCPYSQPNTKQDAEFSTSIIIGDIDRPSGLSKLFLSMVSHLSIVVLLWDWQGGNPHLLLRIKETEAQNTEWFSQVPLPLKGKPH